MRRLPEPRASRGLALALRLVGLAGAIVPVSRRPEWREQWRADLLYRAGEIAAGRGRPASGGELPRRALGAFAHAAWLLGREWRVGMLGHDVRHGLRGMRRRPGLTLGAVLAVGLGVGANATIFTWVRALMLDPLPGVAEPGRLVALTGVQGDRRELSMSWPDFEDLRDDLPPSLDGILAQRPVAVSARLGDRPERVWGALVSAGFFDVLGVTPPLGRGFGPDEDRGPGAHPVVVVSDRFWRERLGGGADAIGRRIQINGHAFTVVGVAPAGFRGGQAAFGLDLYIPMTMQTAVYPGDRLSQRGNGWLRLMARLAPGASRDQAQAELDVAAARLAAHREDEGRGIAVHPLWRAPQSASGLLAPALGLLAGLVGVVLILACVNVAGLLLARAADRERELALRLALGASRWRLVRQLITESVLLALAGGAAGLALALVTSRLLLGMLPPMPLPIEVETGVSWTLVAFGAVLSGATGVLFGLAPALDATRGELASGLRQTGGALAGPRPARLRHALLVGQVALTLVLLVSAGLFLRTLWNARAVDPGYSETRGLLASLDLQPRGLGAEAEAAEYREIARRVAALPGVRAVSLATFVPLSMQGGSDTTARIEGYEPREDERIVIHYNRVTPGYFETLRIPLRAGRDFDERDRRDAPGVAIVNETMARRYWPAGRALGGRLHLGNDELEVIGIVADGRYRSLTEAPLNFMYFSLDQAWRPDVTLHVASEVDPGSLIEPVRQAVAAVDPDLPLYDVRTLGEHRQLAVYLQRLTAILLLGFGLVALLLSVIGIYGVIAQAVARRTQEIGLRLALGARRGQILAMVLRRGMGLTALGLVLGGGVAAAVARLFASQLVGVRSADGATFVATAALLAAAAFAACLVPALRGAAIEPLRALREE